MTNVSRTSGELEQRRLPRLERLEVARLVVGATVLPAAVQDANPLEGKGTEDGLAGGASLSGALVAWFQPRVLLDRLVVNIVAPRGTTLLGVTYAVYHGRFAEMLLAHFDPHFERINIISMPTDNDTV